MNRAGLDLLKSFEAFRAERYFCQAGKPTIGYGHVILPGDTFAEPMTEAFAEALLLKDVAKYESAVCRAVRVDVTENQISAMTSLAFNIGVSDFRKSTVLRKLNEGDYKASADAFLLWDKYTDPDTKELKVSDGLVRRRHAERELFLKG